MSRLWKSLPARPLEISGPMPTTSVETTGTPVPMHSIELPLPSTPLCWVDVSLRTEPYTTEDNLVQFDRSLFRPVTVVMNSSLADVESGGTLHV